MTVHVDGGIARFKLRSHTKNVVVVKAIWARFYDELAAATIAVIMWSWSKMETEIVGW